MRFASGFLAAIVLMILVALSVSYSGVVSRRDGAGQGRCGVVPLEHDAGSMREQASGIAAPRQASEEEIGGVPLLQRGLRLLPRRARRGPDRHRQGTQSRATLST